MTLRKMRAGRMLSRVARKGRLIHKGLYWSIHKRSVKQMIVFILGCQRSGTTMLSDVFDKDYRATLFQEESRITGNMESRLRLKPYEEVASCFSDVKSPLIVAKPLVESQNAIRLLESFPFSRAIWAYRNFRDVVNSDVKRFRRQIPNLRAVLDDQSNNWRSERISKETRLIVKRFYDDQMSRADAAALMWYARNILFFDLELEDRKDVFLWKYEEFVSNPIENTKQMFRFIEIEYPGDYVLGNVDARSVGLGEGVSITPEIDELCKSLEFLLDSVVVRKKREKN